MMARSTRRSVDRDCGPEAVIFDCDGVLVDSEVVTCHVWSEMAAELGYQLSPDVALREFKGGEMAKSVARLEILMGASVPGDFVADLRARMAERFEQELAPIEGIFEVLENLDRPYCVASNGPRTKMDVSLRVTGLLEYFENRIFSAYEVGVFKPAPGLFLEAARAMDVAPARCAVIEDSDLGVVAGLAAGMSVYAFAAGEEAREHERKGAVAFERMEELLALLR